MICTSVITTSMVSHIKAFCCKVVDWVTPWGLASQMWPWSEQAEERRLIGRPPGSFALRESVATTTTTTTTKRPFGTEINLSFCRRALANTKNQWKMKYLPLILVLLYYSSIFLNSRLALCPPNPSELLIAYLISAFRASFGT